jgi:proton-translocating NAD(P)+ transhydrogenase subunit alpha
MIVGVPRESFPGERRVALVPPVIPGLTKAGFEVVMEAAAGLEAGYPDAEYVAKGARIVRERAEVFGSADVVLQVLCHGSNDQTGAADLPLLRRGQTLIGFLRPLGARQTIEDIAARGVTSYAIELMPRTTRAQSMDALSSMGTICGYKAVVMAADTLPRIFPMLTTAAGTIRPAQVLVVGAGVAGLQAIATARRLGAVVEAYDVRSATREQVKSLGAKFVDTGVSAEGTGGYARELTEEEKRKQQEVLDQRIAAADVVITTAAVPGRTAPRIISRSAVERMKTGAVIVDIAAESGGNCELTRAGETVLHHGVRIVGPVNLASQLAYHASEMYARNLLNFLKPAIDKGELKIDWTDEVFAQSCLTHEGEIRHEATRKVVES